MVKIAYLILAHENPELIKRLCDRLVKTGDIFIHIDKKANIGPFLDAVQTDHVFFTKKRYCVNWAGWSMVKGYMQLLDDAYESINKYERFVFMTGQDYPLMRDESIIDEFQKHRDVEYIMAYDIAKSTIATDKDKVERNWYMDPPFRTKILRKIYLSFMYRVFTKNFRVRKLQVPLGGIYVNPYFGQMLSAFTRDGAELLLKTYKNDKKYNKIMKRVYPAVEIYWQTIIFNSELRKNTVQGGKEHKITEHFGWAPLHYHHYYVDTSVFTENDYEEIVNSGYMFFRKVVPGISDTLMDKIDEYRSKSS